MGGNHFVNLAADIETDNVFAIVHTGSRGDLQDRLGALIDTPDKYDALYAAVIASAFETRAESVSVVRSVFGRQSEVDDTAHNTISIEESGDVIVRKGVTHILGEQQTQVLPSSADGLILLYKPGAGARELGATSHGTGRRLPRSAMRREAGGEIDTDDHPAIMTPSQMGSWPLTERSEGYNQLGRSVDILEEYGFVEQAGQRVLQPIAGIKQT